MIKEATVFLRWMNKNEWNFRCGLLRAGVIRRRLQVSTPIITESILDRAVLNRSVTHNDTDQVSKGEIVNDQIPISNNDGHSARIG